MVPLSAFNANFAASPHIDGANDRRRRRLDDAVRPQAAAIRVEAAADYERL